MQEMQRIMKNMRPTFLFIYENMLRLWFIIQSIILGLRSFAPKINDFLWDFNEALHGNYEDIMSSPPSPKKNNNPWCDINADNIINHNMRSVRSNDKLLSESTSEDKEKLE
jgi:hypothetical protein